MDEFNDEVLKELEAIPDSVDQKDLENRKDLTDEIIFTIDGADTKDIDDAISLTYKDNIYTLGVHIADVSHYVKENTALGDEAYNRGTSSYLADTVIPMIPHKLSNGICCNYSIQMHAVYLYRIYKYGVCQVRGSISRGNNKFIFIQRATVLRRQFLWFQKKSSANGKSHWPKVFVI